MRYDSDLDSKRKRDFDDLQNESAGRETGRMRRFLTREDQTPEAVRKKRARQAIRSLLDILLDDPIYRATFHEVTEALTEAMSAVERALAGLALQIDAMEELVEEMDARAARLPDGTRVFRDSQGVVRRADGAIVEDTLAATILWTGDEPSYEQRRDADLALGLLKAQDSEMTGYRDDVLGPAQNRMSDPDDPPSLDELDQILVGVESEMPDIVREHQAVPDQNLQTQPDTTQVVVPKIGG